MPVPSVVAPSLNVTVPLGVPEPGAVAATVAVNVTDAPKTLGFGAALTAVVVAPLFTVCVRPDDVEVVKLLSPP